MGKLAGRIIARASGVVLALLLCAGSNGGLYAQDAASVKADAPPAKVQELLQLLDDPAVRDWLAQHRGTATAGSAATPAQKPATSSNSAASDSAPADTSMTASGYFAQRVADIRQHLASLVTAVPTLPHEFERCFIILSLEFQQYGLVGVLVLIAVFIGLGFGAEWLYYWLAAGVEKWIVGLPLDTVGQRLLAVAVRLAYGTGMVAAFAVGSVGAFLALEWPPLLREIGLGYLLAFLALRLTMVASRFLMAPGGERFRILPMSTAAAVFWHRRLGFLVGWLAFGWVTVGLLRTLGMAVDARHLVAYTLGLGLLAIGLETAWRRPLPDPQPSPRHRRVVAWLLTAYYLLLWLLWVASALPAFWLAVVIAGLPAVIGATQRAVNHILRPPGAADAAAAVPGVMAASLARGLRALFIIGAALLLAWAWSIDLVALTASDTLATRLLRGALNAVVIVLVADFAWHVMKAVIDRKLREAQAAGQAENEEARRRARLRTLLPIFSNLLFIVLVAMALLMALAALGINIGPLIAGAGVVGVAVGFGAQTLVKDVISGMFYLLDDAFRVGEYIQSGNYKGTVESFSLRSVKLRHHRGPLYTVPFGTLGAIQNMSRDWVIDKLMIGVTYDADLDKVKKLIKQIGKELAADPDLGPNIIEPLKMQGVESFGDYAIQIRMKMMTKPNEQFVIRRRAYAMIKKAFEANGIEFASPTVTVAGGAGPAAAIAHQSLELTHKPQEA
jgi:moderate conductance mechanosensitive channel